MMVVTAAGTALSLSRNPHWIFRVFDFPRLQIAIAAVVSALLYWRFFFKGNALEIAVLAAVGLTVIWQFYKIFPYTPLARKQATAVEDPASATEDPNAFSLLVSNVLMENEEHQRIVEVIREASPDVVLAVETDAGWCKALAVLKDEYPHRVEQAQDNYYGMVLMSRLPLVKPKVRFLVQEDVPSIHTGIRLRSGTEIVLHGIHPRPPEPVRDQISAPRDAELVLLGKEIKNDREEHSVVAGDLNDVAWSHTSQLFVRLSRLLDPRVGRGFYNTYNAKNPLFRFPLDHVFHAKTFKLVRLQRLPKIGSDHFPMLIELLHDETAPAEQAPPEKKGSDEKEAQEILAVESEKKAEGKDRPNDD